MGEEINNPVSNAREKYNTLHNYAQNLSEAASQHPDVPYEQSETPFIRTETEILGRDETDLNADIAMYRALLGRELQDTDEIFYFELGREVDEYLRNEDNELFEETWNEHDEIQNFYDCLKDSIQFIDDALETHSAAHKMTDSEKPKLLEPVN